ncbi:complement C1q domain-containing protein [Ostreibacterium oceani]|nr:complement C1q domain-containing protein [Ostreibacterium oceani]
MKNNLTCLLLLLPLYLPLNVGAQTFDADELVMIHHATTTQINAFSPVKGALVYNSDNDTLYVFDGANWNASNNDIITSLVDNNNGSYTYTAEDGAQTTFTISDNQIIDVYSLNGDGKNLDLSLENDGQATKKVDLSALNITGDVTGTLANTGVAKIQNVDVSATAPSDGQALVYNGANSQWEPTALIGGAAVFPQILVDASRTSDYNMNQNYQTVIYNSVAINSGTSYNIGNGVFTTPDSGMYQIMYNNQYGYTNYRNHTVFNRIMINSAVEMESANGSWTNGNGNGNRAYATNTGNTIVQLNAGQTVRVEHRANTNQDNISPRTGAGQHRLKIIRLK